MVDKKILCPILQTIAYEYVYMVKNITGGKTDNMEMRRDLRSHI